MWRLGKDCLVTQTLTLNTAQLKEKARELHVFDRVLLSGTVYTARDAAHRRFIEQLESGDPLPIELSGATIYYAGPTPTPEGLAIGSCGPTTSGRMDPYVPRLMELGLIAMIGKGERDQEVIDAIVKHHGVYFCALGGAGALAARCIQSCEVVAYPELGCESVKRLVLKDFPLITAVDSTGQSIFTLGKKQYTAK